MKNLLSLLFAGSLLLGQAKIHEYEANLFGNRVGKIIFSEDSTKFFSFKMNIPIPYIGDDINNAIEFFGGEPIYPYKEKAIFMKPNDSTYIEKYKEGYFEYKKRGNEWVITKAYDSGEEKKELGGQVMVGVPIVDAIYREFNGGNKRKISIFTLGTTYDGEIGKINDYNGFSTRIVLFDKFYLRENGQLKKVIEDKNNVIGNMELIYENGKITSAHMNIKKPLPTELKIRKK